MSLPMPSTPLRVDGTAESEGSGDTERPPAEGSQPVLGAAPGPASGVASASPDDATRVGPPPPLPLAGAARKPLPPPALPSSSKLVAAPPSSSPQLPASAPRVPVRAPAATIVHAGAPPASASVPVAVAAPLPRPVSLARPQTPSFQFTPGGAMATSNTVPAPSGETAVPSSARMLSAEGEPVPLTRRCTACNELYPPDFLVCPRDATPLVDESGEAMDPLVGKLLGETYQIIRVVGEGGMGRIYEARHLRLKERRFAVKTLHTDLARNGEMAARFLREAETASSISHPNVVDVFDVHHLPDGTPYFVGEFLEGMELAEFVERNGPLDPKQAARVGRQICSALALAHGRGVIHRDMKPENVFVLQSSIDAVATGAAKNLTVKILDFGISKAGGDERTHLTRTGVIMGTPSYMAPEQARGKAVDHRADIYSVGAVLYFALTGKRPFDSDDPTVTITMVLTQDPVRLRQHDSRIPESLELVVQRAMAKDPRERYQSMVDLEKALEGVFRDGRRTSQSIAVPPSRASLPGENDSSAFDVAKAMLAGASLAPPSSTSNNQAKLARPTIIAMSSVLGLWLVGGTTASLAGLVRVLHDGEITVTESVLLVVGCLFAAATPLALYVLHVRKVIWPNSVRALQLSADLKRTATAALATYGGLAIAARIGHTVLARSSKGLTSGVWDIALFLVSVLAAATVGGAGPMLRNMRRRRNP
jgi:serine/threonine protein kinase